jgi:hypothetical protein
VLHGAVDLRGGATCVEAAGRPKTCSTFTDDMTRDPDEPARSA